MKVNPLPAKEELWRLFFYDPLSGELRWRVRPAFNSRRRAGDIAGGLGGRGYLVVTIGKQDYQVHRIAWKMITGSDPEDIDHDNRDRTDNRWANLKSVSHAVNLVNKAHKNKHRGVHFISARGVYGAQIKRHGKHTWLGCHPTPEAACAAYRAAADAFNIRYDKTCDCA